MLKREGGKQMGCNAPLSLLSYLFSVIFVIWSLLSLPFPLLINGGQDNLVTQARAQFLVHPHTFLLSHHSHSFPHTTTHSLCPEKSYS